MLHTTQYVVHGNKPVRKYERNKFIYRTFLPDKTLGEAIHHPPGLLNLVPCYENNSNIPVLHWDSKYPR